MASARAQFTLKAAGPLLVVVCLPMLGMVANGQQTGAPREGVTFTRNVAPIVFEHCATCHRPGEAAPFSLLNYTDVKQRARLIADATASHVMPPWQPDSEAGEFEGDRRLSEREIATIQRWVEGGMVEGEPGDLPPLPDFSRPWRLGNPDLVLTLPEVFTVPADGADVFRNFVLPIPVTERRFVKALEFRPGNARVVHHVRMLLDDSGEIRLRDAADSEPGFGGMDVPGARFPDGHFLGWAPGKMPDTEQYPWPLEPGTDLVLQLHLKPSGRPEQIQPQIALYFTDQAPSTIPIMVRLGVKTIDIPAGEPRYDVTDSYVLPVDVTVTSIYPHAHYLAKEMNITAKKSDGGVETLLRIPNWNFNWQDEYHYRRPFVLRKGTTITMRYTYDNSAANPHNPTQPPRRVKFGSETTDEMGEMLLQVLPKNASDAPKLRSDITRKNLLTDIAGEEKLLKDTPGDVDTRNALGVAYAQLGRGADAARQFEEAVRQDPAHPQALYNLGVIAMAEQRPDAAREYLVRALTAHPDYAEAHNNLGVLLEATGHPEEALDHYRRALVIRPANAAALNNFGRALLARGDVTNAVAQLKAALRTRPDHPDALYNLGRASIAQKRPDEAVTYWKRSLATRPDSLPVLLDLAAVLTRDPDVQNPGEAVRFAEQANKLSGNSNVVVLDLLSSAYAADGRLDMAARVAQRALQRAVAAKDEGRVADIRQRLDLYLSHQDASGGGPDADPERP